MTVTNRKLEDYSDEDLLTSLILEVREAKVTEMLGLYDDQREAAAAVDILYKEILSRMNNPK